MSRPPAAATLALRGRASLRDAPGGETLHRLLRELQQQHEGDQLISHHAR